MDLTKYVIYGQDTFTAFGNFGEVYKAALIIGSDKRSVSVSCFYCDSLPVTDI